MGRGKDEALKSIFKGASIVFIGVIASKLLSFGFRILVGRRLGVADYGVITVMMAVFSVANTFGHMGLNQGVQRFVSMYRAEEDTEGMIGLARTGYLMILVPSSIVAVSVFFLAPWLATTVWSDPKLVWPIRMAVLAVPLYGIARVSISVLNAFEKMQYKVYINKLWANISQLVIAAVLIAVGYGYMGAAFGFAFGFGSSAVLGLLFVNKVFPAVFERVTGRYEFSELWSHSWPLFAAGVFGIVSGHIDTFMLQAFKDATAVGLYQAAFPFAALLTVGPGLFSGIFFSNASKLEALGDREEFRRTYRTTVKWIAIVTVPVFLILFAFPKTALFVFGAEYYETTITLWGQEFVLVEAVLRMLLLGFILKAITGPVGRVYQAVERTKLNFVTSAVVATGNFVLNLVLIPIYGPFGAAIASTGAFVLVFVLELGFLRWVLSTQPFRLATVKVVLAGVIALLVPYGVSNTLFAVTPTWFFVVDVAVFSAIYAVLLLVFQTIEEDDLVILRAIREKFGLELEWVEKLVRRFS